MARYKLRADLAKLNSFRQLSYEKVLDNIQKFIPSHLSFKALRAHTMNSHSYLLTVSVKKSINFSLFFPSLQLKHNLRSFQNLDT